MSLSEQEANEVCGLVTTVLCEHEHEMYMYMKYDNYSLVEGGKVHLPHLMKWRMFARIIPV